MRQPVPFGKYLLLDRISVGGMAEVFKAKSYGVEGFEKIIAIKRILPTMGEDRDFIKMFIDEAKIAGQLAHANICQIFELGRIDGAHFIAMEYIWEKPLQIQNRLRKNKQPMPIPMACFGIAKVLEGLDYAHRKRDPLGRPLEIVHRDCSPQNVLISYEGEVKVIDFGIAKATSRNSRTMAGVLKGKFGYMSPEQVRGLPLDRRSDIFALGTMLYECLTGERLFQGETDFSTLEKVRNVDVANPRSINPAIPEAIEKVIMKALAKDVDERYQWCSEMLADLQQFLMSQDVVFTAKSLSSWLKEMFNTEIERERQQLEQYKRVGRDGLIAGLPSAEAKLDVVEHLGEAPPIEGDATTLGGPNFEDMEDAIAAAAAAGVGPAPGSPASRGSATEINPEGMDTDSFGEEAPTEIFGEIDHGVNPARPTPVPAAAAPPAAGRVPTVPPSTRPPSRPPVNRAPTGRPASDSLPLAATAVAPATAAPASATRSTQPAIDPGLSYGAPPPVYGGAQNYLQGNPQPHPAAAGLPPVGFPQQQGYGPPPGYYAPQPGYTPPQHHAVGPSGQPMGMGMPGAQPQPLDALGVPGQNPGKTLTGAAPPPGVPNYAQGYPPPRMSGPPGMHGYPVAPQSYPQQPMGYPPSQGHAYMPPGSAYGSMAQPAIAKDPVVPTEGKKRSSIGRDVAIGVAIAALVLGGFLVVKFAILDSDGDSKSTTDTPTSTIASLTVKMPTGINAELFLDGKRIATVSSDTKPIPVSAGQHKLKLVAANGQHCEQEMKLAAGGTGTFDCVLYVGTGSAAGSGAVDPNAKGSAAAVPQGSAAAVPQGSAAIVAQGSAAKPIDPKVPEVKVDPKTTDPKATDPKATDVKPADATKPVETKTDLKAADSKIDPKVDAKAIDPKKPVEAKVDPKIDPKTIDPKKPVEAKVDPKAIDPKTDPKKPVETKVDPKKPVETKVDPKKPVDTTKPLKPIDDNPADRALNGGGTAKPGGDQKGYLVLSSKPSAKISIDGVDTGLSTPIGGKTLPLGPGKHKVTFAIGGDKFTFSVTIKAGATETLSKDLQ